MNEMCVDNRFEMISKAKNDLIKSTNIETAADEMKVLDSFLYRCWQMGWLDQYDTSKQEREAYILENYMVLLCFGERY